ncbi:MAG: HAMP domain-containing sensor histidine kinase [Pseudomonadota bacterium]
MSVTPDDELLSFLYQIPDAVMRIAGDGEVQQINPAAVSLLLPLAGTARLDNAFDLLEQWVPDLRQRFAESTQPGPVIAAELVRTGSPYDRTLSFTMSRLDSQFGVISLHDVSEREELRRAVGREREDAAEARGMARNAAAVLHDVGNATSAIGTTVSLLFSDADWDEVRILKRLAHWLDREAEALDQVMGQQRAEAFVSLLAQLRDSLAHRQDRVEETARSLAQGVSHITDVLSIQRVSSAGGKLKSVEVDLRQVARDAVSLQQATLGKRQVEIELRLGAEPALVSGDVTRLIQLGVNLLRNAVEAYDEDRFADVQRTVTVAVDRVGNDACLQVTDRGCGFERLAPELFDETVSTKGRASGLGLAHCQQIAESHYGSLELVSPGTGLGATATLKIPLTR